MKTEAIYSIKRLGTLLLMVLLTFFVSCSSDEVEVEPKLNIYVYAPERAAITRGESIPTEEEAKIHNLQIWVFRSGDPSRIVASLTLRNEDDLQGLNEHKSASYSISLEDRTFAEKPEPVDIYVMANVLDNNGTNYFESINSGSDLEEAVFNGGHFFSFTQGPAYQAATTVPADKGVPMSGVARGKSVVDKNNVLHVNEANVKLVRTVSKIRFVFSSLEGSQLFVDNISLNESMMYRKVRFFLDGDHPDYWVEDPFDSNVKVLLVKGDKVNPVVQNENPTDYAYSSSMTDQEYEELVDDAVNDGNLTEFGPVYLPESDKRLSGTITFRIGSGGSPMTTSFSMAKGNFRRNQTWIVYAYYIGSSKLEVNTVKVVEWEEEENLPDHDVPNW